MKVHQLSIQNPTDCPTFDMIKTGIKTVEGRKNSAKYQEYCIGDIIQFHCGNETVKAKITYIHKYADVHDYLRGETLKRALPNIKTIKKAIEMYARWVPPSEIAELRKRYGYGFLGIGIALI